MHCAALALHLTTRMPVLWMCVGMCGTGIGVVFEALYFCPPCPTYSTFNTFTGFVRAVLMDWYDTINNVIRSIPNMVIKNIHTEMST